jgi:voltage-gated potassium channel
LSLTFKFLTGLLSISLLGGTFVFWFSEPQGLTFIDILWWWIATSTTVGYGDIVPVTIPGRIAATIVIFIGVYGYTYIISLILNTVRNKLEAKERGLLRIGFKNHIVICSYTAYADELIQEIKAKNLFPEKEIVIVTNLVERIPYPEHHFVYGIPICPATLKRANIQEADIVFVFTNERFATPDRKTLHVVSRVMRLNQHATICVELNVPDRPMVESLPRPIIVMGSEDIQESVLAHHYINVQRYLPDD